MAATARRRLHSGSDALLLPLLALGVGPGDEVITSPYTFFATGGAVWRTGARPVFVDIDPDSYNIDPSRIEDAITDRTRVILPVHLYGQTADMAPIQDIASRHGLSILEDAAQAIGRGLPRQAQARSATSPRSALPVEEPRRVRRRGDADHRRPRIARKTARLRVHGMEPKYHHHEVGFNSRLDALQAAVLRVKLRHLDAWTEGRRLVAERYHALFQEAGLGDEIVTPSECEGRYHVFNQYVIRVAAGLRDPLRAHLSSKRVGTEIYYPIPLHLQVCFAGLGHRRGDFPHSEAAAAETIALPMYPELSEDAQSHVVTTIARFMKGEGRRLAGNERAA
ncbi:MAG: DegT/DnrJ/EryC1/StrS family aminotransferase [Isosphaeraceae bacterium]